MESYYANTKFQSDCGDYVTAAAALKSYCDITQTPGVPGSGPNGMSALWGRLACEVRWYLLERCAAWVWFNGRVAIGSLVVAHHCVQCLNSRISPGWI